jgi:erythromycin esterase
MREAAMAANIKWILDQSPKAKIVLWAHNLHVMTSGDSMGGKLRRMYGDKMVTFGFAFDEGSFQAFSAAADRLKNFTVPSAPARSLDATLKAAGIPLFALDLRTLPKTGPVTEWFSSGHTTRSIGSNYEEDWLNSVMVDQVAPQAFDAFAVRGENDRCPQARSIAMTSQCNRLSFC